MRIETLNAKSLFPELATDRTNPYVRTCDGLWLRDGGSPNLRMQTYFLLGDGTRTHVASALVPYTHTLCDAYGKLVA